MAELGVHVWLFLLVVAVASVGAGVANKSCSGGGGLYLATAKEEEEGNLLVKKPASDSEPTPEYSAVKVGEVVDTDDFDGGFSSLDGMLHWAIGHSNPARLRQTAQSVQHLSADELQKRQLEIKDLMEKSKMPSDAQLMQIAITDLNNSSLSLEDRRRALQELLVLVELIDNANDLDKLGGIAVVIRELNNSDLQIRIASAWILGKASQNNPVVQKQASKYISALRLAYILQLGALTKLMKMVKSSSVEEGIKAMYAVSALIRNNLDGHEMFFAGDGDSILQDIMSNSSMDIRLRKKSASLVADLADFQLQVTNKAEPPLFSNRYFLKSVVDLTASSDFDLQEKALMAVKSLLKLKTTKALDFKDFCGLDGVMERTREQLQQLMGEEYQRDFARDMENLCREVELIFRRKLEEVHMI
ncbi:Nucleotide exchange factor Fes1 [Macleaya cordata]|uniref:Nucleotide exchange factor Fes1 n=1 Tax=Macleaya cordata TaxID=56857 RepID=A0A200PY15_MACCD|nr:Nucleotide exchange factor Fes1 [Macleaya cordata]